MFVVFHRLHQFDLATTHFMCVIVLLYFKISACPGVNTILDYLNDFIKIELDFRLTFYILYRKLHKLK